MRELFESGPARPERIRTKDLYKCVDADYYGYLDEVDARLIKLEADQERKLGGMHWLCVGGEYGPILTMHIRARATL